MSACFPDGAKYIIRIRSKRAGRVVEEVTGTCFNSVELQAIASDIWNEKYCLSDDYGLRVYRAIGHPARWNNVEQIGLWQSPSAEILPVGLRHWLEKISSESDFMGWEVKQYGVNDFVNFRPKSPVTLMTPEPTGGIYRNEGVTAFMNRFGYPDQSGKPDRLNFGGRYDCQRGHHTLTGLRMALSGYDADTGKITDLDGGLTLLDAAEEVAASWTFKGMMAHWNRKHAQAAYVPSLFRTPPPEYSYGAHVLLCEQTDFLLFLKAFAAGTIYYDPAVKIENASSAKPKTKQRSQFRVAHSDLTQLYQRYENIQL